MFVSRIESLERRLLLSAPTQWTSQGPGGGGAMFAPSFSPFNSQELFATTDMSEMFHSTSLGASWNIIPFTEIQTGRASQVQFTNDPKILYAVDFTTFPLGDELGRPSKSADGGATWTTLQSFPGDNVYALFADPSNANNVIATDYADLYFSNNGGTSFTLKYSAPNSGAGLFVGGAFFDGSNIYLGTTDGLLVSSNGGSTFAIQNIGGIPAGQTIFSFAGAKQNGTTRFFCVTLDSGDVFPGLFIEGIGSSFQSIYSLDVGQANWAAHNSGIAAGDYPNFVSMARNNISVAYVAGASANSAPIVYKTTNGGGGWTPTLFTASNQNVATGWQGQGGDSGWSFGEVTMAFQVSPLDPNVAAFTDFGYLHLTTDGGATWRQAYVDPKDQNPIDFPTPQHKAYHGIGLEPTSAIWLDWTDPADAGRMFAGYTDITGVGSFDSGSSWSFPNYGGFRQNTIYHVETDASTGITYAATSSVHDLYQSTYLTDARIDGGSGRVIMSSDHGTTWSLLHDFGHPVVWTALDPTNPKRMYASVVHSTAGGIFVTNNLDAGAASTWTKVTNPPRTEGHPFNIVVLNDGSLVVTYSGRRTNVFTASSGVFISPDQGTTWFDRTDTVLTGMKYWTKDITIDPTDPTQNTWFASVRSGYGGTGNGMGGLYRSTNRGVNWTRIFTDEGVESCSIDPQANEIFVTTTGDGLWYGTNFHAAQPTFTRTNYPFRQPERVFLNPNKPGEIWVASFGWGLASASTVVGNSISGVVFNDPNSNGVQNAGEAGIGNWILYLDANNNNVKEAGETSATTDASGNYTFNGLVDSTYHVKQQIKAGYRKTLPGSGIPGYDVAVAGAPIAGKNFGDTTNILLAGKVTNDVTKTAIAGVVIKIVSNNTIVASRTTDASGAWQVKGLSAGTGEADVILPVGYTFANPASGKYAGTMTSGQANANLNFALAPVASPVTAAGFSGIRIVEIEPEDDLNNAIFVPI